MSTESQICTFSKGADGHHLIFKREQLTACPIDDLKKNYLTSLRDVLRYDTVNAIRITKFKITGSTKIDSQLKIWLMAANWLSKIVFKTKELNSNRLQKNTYATLRSFGLRSSPSCNICKVVTAAYKTAKTLNKWELAVFKSQIMSITWKCDFRLGRRGLTLWDEVLTVHDPRPFPLTGLRGSSIKKVKNEWYLLLTHDVEIPKPKKKGSIVGVDFGVKRLMAATNSENSKTFFFKGGRLNHRRACIRRTRSKIQTVGTRSSRRLLKRLAGNEASVTEVLLHTASKALVRYAVENGARRIVLEDLTNIRDRTVSARKEFRAAVNRWPFANGQFKIAYKAAAQGIAVEKVSPVNTSRGCSACGHVSASNRKGLRFHCVKCGYSDDADRNASKNIRLRSISIRHNQVEMGSRSTPESSEPSEIPVLSPARCGDASGVQVRG